MQPRFWHARRRDGERPRRWRWGAHRAGAVPLRSVRAAGLKNLGREHRVACPPTLWETSAEAPLFLLSPASRLFLGSLGLGLPPWRLFLPLAALHGGLGEVTFAWRRVE